MREHEAYYNENDPKAAQWLRNLIRLNLITPGHVDERSIVDVTPDDVVGYRRVHWFAGIAGWERALKLAEWGDEPVWTGSCPCQPFSAAGKQKAQDDERHLWPELMRLVRSCKPKWLFGEQVSTAIRHGWLDGIQADLEAEDYTVGATVLGAHCVGAPHIRQRLYWGAARTAGHRRGPSRDVRQFGDGGLQRGWEHGFEQADCRIGERLADADGSRHEWAGVARENGETEGERSHAINSVRDGQPRRWAGPPRQPIGEGLEGHTWNVNDRNKPGRFVQGSNGPTATAGGTCDSESSARLGDTTCGGLGIERDEAQSRSGRHVDGTSRAGLGHWDDFILIPCRDGKARRIKPGIAPLAHGVSGRLVVRRTVERDGSTVQEENTYSRTAALRGIGNAIVPPLAAVFIRAFRETA